MLALALASSSFSPSGSRPAQIFASRRAAVLQPTCVAQSDTDKAVLAAAKKVTLAAKRFGVFQGKVAQLWVEEALRGGKASPTGLMEVEAALFDECTLDDGGRCEMLESGMDELLAAVAKRSGSHSTGFFEIKLGAEPVQAATAKVRAAASAFGPEQKQAAEDWIKKVVGGELAMGAQAALLEEQIMLFGECVLSEDSTPSNCEQLEEALEELQAALEMCDIASKNVGRVTPTKPSRDTVPAV